MTRTRSGPRRGWLTPSRQGHVEPSASNPWALVPDGIYHMRGLMRESKSKALANREKRRQAKEAALGQMARNQPGKN